MSAVVKQGPIFKYMDKARWSDAWFILRRTDAGPEIQLFKDSSAKKSFADAIPITAINASTIRFGKTSKAIEKAPECGKDLRLCEEAFIAITYEKAQKKGAATMETMWLCALSTADMFELLRMFAAAMHKSNHEAPSPADDDDYTFGSDCIPEPFMPVNDWERFWANPPMPEPPAPVATPPGKMKKAKSVGALNDVKVDKKKDKKRTPTVTVDDSKLDDRNRRESLISVLSSESDESSAAVTATKGKNDKKKETKPKEKPDKKKSKKEEAKTTEVVAELRKAEELPEEKPQKKEKPKVAPKPKQAKERKSSSSSLSSSSMEEKPKVVMAVAPGNKNKKDKKTANGEEKKPTVVHSEAQTDSENSSGPSHRSLVKPAGYEAVVDQLKSKDAAKANGAKPAPPPAVPQKQKQQPPLPLPKPSLPNSEDGNSSEDEASYEDALERGMSLMQKPKTKKTGEYTVSQYEANDKEEKMAKHTVVYDQNGHDVEHHSVEIASTRH